MSRKSRMLFALLAIMLVVYFVYSRTTGGGHDVLYGATELKDKTFTGDLKLSGATTFSDIKVEGATKIEGPVTDSKNGTFALLDITGPANMEDIKATKLSMQGPLTCKECKFESINVLGPVTLNESTIADVTVTGPLSGKKITVTNKAQVFGPVSVKDSTFNQLEFNSMESSFEDSTITEMVIAADENNRKQVVELKGNTVVENGITFKSGIGEVVVHGDDVKIKGIVGGVRKVKIED